MTSARLEHFLIFHRSAVGVIFAIALGTNAFRSDRSVYAGAPDYQRDVRPILAEHCFRCHGLDAQARQAELRLDRVEEATRPSSSGRIAIAVGRPEESELLRRIVTKDEQTRMPPQDAGKSLNSNQVQTLREWIGAGAPYSEHWAFSKPKPNSLPDVRDTSWPKNFIDTFVLHRLDIEGLRPSPSAQPERLLRRVWLDLVGMPPTPEAIDAFLIQWNRDPDSAYENTVDRLLSSSHLGERLAIDWLDGARYADTNGYFGDRPRVAWPWRDWVIQAFNSNQPFDDFTVEQIAGDLLPEANRDQKIATGFVRNSMANNETGIIDEEFRVEAVADRIETMASVWMGLTVGCAQCHDHKYDPISQREYYQLFAYFNNLDEGGLVTQDSPPPTIEVPTDEQLATVARLSRERAELENSMEPLARELEHQLVAWKTDLPSKLSRLPMDASVVCDFDSDQSLGRVVGNSLVTERGVRGLAARLDATQHVEVSENLDVDRPWTVSVWFQPTGSLNCICSKIEPTERRRGIEFIWQKGRLQMNLVHRWGSDEIVITTRDAVSSGGWHHLLVSYDGNRRAGGVRVVIDGHPAALNVLRDALSSSISCSEPLRIGRRDSGLGFYGLIDEFRFIPRVVEDEESKNWKDTEQLLGIHSRSEEELLPVERQLLRDYYMTHEAPQIVQSTYQKLQLARQAERESRSSIPTALVMKEREKTRDTFLLIRGQYDARGDVVQPATLEALAAAPLRSEPNRLGLARWLVSSDHPLTARVGVNRFWQIFFGEGLVRTPNDFGTQGESPTHPELLDELSLRWMQSGWEVKQLLRWIVTSATYRQASEAVGDSLERDPDNRLLSRGPRFRLSAELVRDQALSASGLLSSKLGGPSVHPYQPEGLWEAVSYNAEDSYQPDQGEGLWRRSLYTYWKRQSPPPALQTFDAPTREKCLIRRPRTNTPLQALVLLNDPTYMAAAQTLALQSFQRTTSDEERIRNIFRRVLSRWPEREEVQSLARFRLRQQEQLANEPHLASLLVREADAMEKSCTELELAAWTLVAHTILNLDEAITRR